VPWLFLFQEHNKVKEKGKVRPRTREQARKAQRGNRGVALLFL
jgi:hypothetical protein